MPASCTCKSQTSQLDAAVAGTGANLHSQAALLDPLSFELLGNMGDIEGDNSFRYSVSYLLQSHGVFPGRCIHNQARESAKSKANEKVQDHGTEQLLQ